MTLENSQSEIFVLENFALYDTDVAGYGLDIAENINPTQPQLNSIQSENIATEEITPIQSDKSDFDQIVFIDSTVEDTQTLIDNISGTPEIIILDDNEDELIQISQHLSEYQELDAVHIVSHGESGQLSFGNTELNRDTLPKYTDLLGNWDNSLITEADLVFYGCDVASGEDGLYFMEELSQITDADISASVDDTGQGGDWELEAKVGEVEATSIFDSDIDGAYQHTLVNYEFILEDGADDGFEIDDGFDDDFNDQIDNELFGSEDDNDDDEVDASDYDSFANLPADNLVSLAEDGLNFAEVSPEALATIDFNNIPAEDFQILKDAGLSLNSLSPEAMTNINLGVFKNFDHLSQIELTATRFNEFTTFGELSSTFTNNANLYTYKPDLDIAAGLNLDKINQLSLSDFQALEYAYLADGAFDASFYLQEYTDIRDDGINPITHYAQSGQNLNENRYPNQVFKGVAESEEIILASANTDFQLVKDVASTFDESETVAFAPAIPLIYYTISGAVVFTLLGLETLRQANNWNEAFENSDFEYYSSPEPIVGPIPGIDITGRFSQPNQEAEGETVLKFPGADTDSDIGTGTPPFDLGEAVEVNILDFPGADDDLQDLLDGRFEFPADDNEGGAYFLSIDVDPEVEPFANLPRGSISPSDLDLEALEDAANQPFGNGSLTVAGRALTKHAAGQRGTSPFPPLSGNNTNINQTAQQQVDEILNSPDANFRKLGRGGIEARLPDGRGVRFNKDGSLSGFVD